MNLHRSMMGLVFCLAAAVMLRAADQPAATSVLSLDGTWSLAIDPQNVGREQKWFEKDAVEGAKPAKVPWIIQEAFPGYHGVAWYWREFDAAGQPASRRAVPAAFLAGRLPGRGLAQRRRPSAATRAAKRPSCST